MKAQAASCTASRHRGPQQVAGCTLLGKVVLSPKGLGQPSRDWEDHLSSWPRSFHDTTCWKYMKPGVKSNCVDFEQNTFSEDSDLVMFKVRD